MAVKNAAPPKKDNSGAIIAGLAVAGAIGVAALLITKSVKAAPTGPTATFTPTSAAAGAVITVNGTGWSPSETISTVSIGSLTTVNTLTVDSAGNLTGTITIPTIMKGSWPITITGSVSGPLSYAFTVSSGIWAILGSTTLAVPVGTAYPVGWIPLNSTTLTVPVGASYPVGWITVTSTTLTVPVAPSYPVGWITITSTTLLVTHSSPNPVGWIPLASTSLVVQHVVYVPQLTISPTTLKTGDTLSFTFYNFTPMATVNVSVIGGGGLSVTANALGSGTGSFAIGEPAGTYTLQASDPYGKSATANFVVQASSGPTFPAPGTPGDGNYWYWVEWQGGTYGWDDYMDAIIQHDPLVLQVISGPYASGATS